MFVTLCIISAIMLLLWCGSVSSSCAMLWARCLEWVRQTNGGELGGVVALSSERGFARGGGENESDGVGGGDGGQTGHRVATTGSNGRAATTTDGSGSR